MKSKEQFLSVGDWAFSSIHDESVRILDIETVWGRSVYQVWVPRLGVMERVPAESLSAGHGNNQASLDRILYAISAAKIADALTQDVLLAPLEAGVIPLPHQLDALSRAVTGDRVRFLLADEVGLGKTIEAGLIFRELKLRGLVKRVLVVAPKGLVTQWVQEMQTHFGESFRLLTPNEFSNYRSLTGTENVWRQFDQVACPVDSVKPEYHRFDWTKDCYLNSRSLVACFSNRTNESGRSAIGMRRKIHARLSAFEGMGLWKN